MLDRPETPVVQMGTRDEVPFAARSPLTALRRKGFLHVALLYRNGFHLLRKAVAARISVGLRATPCPADLALATQVVLVDQDIPLARAARLREWAAPPVRVSLPA